MPVWIVRAGRNGEREEFALEKNVVVINFRRVPDVSRALSREDIAEAFAMAHAACRFPEARVASWVRQIWTFVERIRRGDLVILPRMGRYDAAIGQVTGPYRYRADFPPDALHTHAVEWLRRSVPRTLFDDEMQRSLNVPMTVYQPRPAGAEARVRSVLERMA